MRIAIPLITLLAIAACKPPPSDEATTGRMFTGEPDAPPPPLDSPDSEGALWSASETQGRIIYGQAGKAPLMALQCVGDDADARLQIERLSPADEGAGAFLAIVGNSHVARIPVDATKVEGGFIWRGNIEPDAPDLAALTGPREVTATLPGAGMVTLTPSERLKQAISDCRALALPKPSLDILGNEDTQPETIESESPAQ